MSPLRFVVFAGLAFGLACLPRGQLAEPEPEEQPSADKCENVDRAAVGVGLTR